MNVQLLHCKKVFNCTLMVRIGFKLNVLPSLICFGHVLSIKLAFMCKMLICDSYTKPSHKKSGNLIRVLMWFYK